MGVLVDFEPDERALASAFDMGAERVSLDRLRDRHFIFPVRFLVNGVDLLASIDATTGTCRPWLPLPIVDRAVAMLIAVDEAWLGPLVEDDPNEFGADAHVWHRAGEAIVIDSTLATPCAAPGAIQTVSGCAPYTEMRAACLAFSARVRSYLVRGLPSLAAHPEAGAWFRGEVELPESDLAELYR